MNASVIKYALFILMAITSVMASGQFTETREMNKKYMVTPETKIEISNKYGKIDLHTWDKDSVVIQVTVKVEEKKLSKLEQTLDDIDFEFTNSGHYLIARTIVGNSRNPIENEIQKFRETILQAGSNIEINFGIWLPGKNNIKVENKFGDIFLDDFEGETEITLSNGNLKAHDLKAEPQ